MLLVYHRVHDRQQDWPDAFSFGKISNTSRIDHGGFDLVLGQLMPQQRLIAAGGFHDDRYRCFIRFSFWTLLGERHHENLCPEEAVSFCRVGQIAIAMQTHQP